MHLVVARQSLSEPEQRGYHPLAAAAVEAARRDQDDLHDFSTWKRHRW
jgi:hypothetical protein